MRKPNLGPVHNAIAHSFNKHKHIMILGIQYYLLQRRLQTLHHVGHCGGGWLVVTELSLSLSLCVALYTLEWDRQENVACAM